MYSIDQEPRPKPLVLAYQLAATTILRQTVARPSGLAYTETMPGVVSHISSAEAVEWQDLRTCRCRPRKYAAAPRVNIY